MVIKVSKLGEVSTEDIVSTSIHPKMLSSKNQFNVKLLIFVIDKEIEPSWKQFTPKTLSERIVWDFTNKELIKKKKKSILFIL